MIVDLDERAGVAAPKREVHFFIWEAMKDDTIAIDRDKPEFSMPFAHSLATVACAPETSARTLVRS